MRPRSARLRRSGRAAPMPPPNFTPIWITVNYREAYNFHASNGILFNHEGPRRGETFVTRKITRAVAAISRGLQSRLYLGNLDAIRDWGHARDYALGMWLILQQDEPDDYVLASGESHSVREFVERAFAHVGRTIVWKGTGVDEVGIDRRSGEILVKVDPRYFRPTEVETLQGDSGKARQRLRLAALNRLRRSGPGNGRGRPGASRNRAEPAAMSEPPLLVCTESASGSPATAGWSARRWCAGFSAKTSR